jgi:hypothetical protein
MREIDTGLKKIYFGLTFSKSIFNKEISDSLCELRPKDRLEHLRACSTSSTNQTLVS